MRHTPRLPREQRRAQLLEAATAVFVRSGYRSASMEEIAQAAGITKPVLYQHFDSKEHLARAVIEQLGASLVDQVRAIGDASDTTEGRVQAGLTRFYELIARGDALQLFTTGSADAPEMVQAQVAKVLDQMAREVAGVLTAYRQVDDEQARQLGHAMISLARTTAALMRGAADDAARAEVMDTMTRLATSGLAAFPEHAAGGGAE